MVSITRPHLAEGSLVLDKYIIVDVLHNGSMSNVYLVRDKSLGNVWCLKESYKDDTAAGRIRYEGILRDAHILKGLKHAGIPRIVALEEEEDRAYILMDYVGAQNLQQALYREGELTAKTTVMLMKQLAAVMSYLHSKRIIYRDLKPSNIMVVDGQVKLLDFGISEAVGPDNMVIREALGTKGYAPPEQGMAGTEYDFRSDIYSFGATMFQALTNVAPFVFQSKEVTLEDGRKRSRLDQKKPLDIRGLKTDLSQGLQELVLKATAFDPADRYQTFSEVLFALQNYETLDRGHRRKYKRRLNALTTLGVSAALLIGTSFIPGVLNERQKVDVFQDELAAARQSDQVVDYYEALTLKPTEISAYPDMVNAIKQDGVFDSDEQRMLLDLLNPNLIDLRAQNTYGDLAFSVGQLFWFYNESSDSKSASTRWFEDAVTFNASEQEQANVLLSIGLFEKNISGAVMESTDAGMYKTYWDNLVGMKEFNSGEILQIQLYLSIADAINNYSFRLKSDGVTQESLQAEIDFLTEFVSSAQVSPGRSQDLLDDLSAMLGGLEGKVELAYRTPSAG